MNTLLIRVILSPRQVIVFVKSSELWFSPASSPVIYPGVRVDLFSRISDLPSQAIRHSLRSIILALDLAQHVIHSKLAMQA